MDDALACRLIQACNLAYLIDATGTGFTGETVNTLVTAAGLRGDTARFSVHGEHGIDACFFARTTDGNGVLAFRGTLAPTLAVQDLAALQAVIEDWLQDAEAALVVGANLPGKVHRGFLKSLDGLWPDIASWDLKSVPALYVTGHSKGGSLSHLAASRLQKTGVPVSEVYSFAAARAANSEFVRDFNQTIPSCWRFEYRDDIVPHLPPASGRWLQHLASFQGQTPGQAAIGDLGNLIKTVQTLANRGYASAGTLQFINWDDQPKIEQDSFWLDLRRNLHLAEMMGEHNLREIAEDHSSSGGYLTGVCGAPATPGV